MTKEDEIRQLRAEGNSMRRTAKLAGVSICACQKVLDPDYLEKSRVYMTERRRKQSAGEEFRPYLGARDNPAAQDSLDERDRVYAPRSFDIRYDVLGDPLPGRSALDRRNDAANSGKLLRPDIDGIEPDRY